MDFLNGLDGGHLLGSGGVATAIWWVSVKVLKPLLEGFLDKMPKAIADNTSAVKELIEQQQRASGYTRSEHAEIVTHLTVLTDTLLKTNGEEPVKKTVKPIEDIASNSGKQETVSKQEFDELQNDVRRVIAHLRGED